MEIYQWGLAVWNDNTSSFEPLRIVWTKSDDAPNPPTVPQGHSALWKDDQGKEWMLFGNPLPALRCPATFEAWQDPSTWEVLKPQESIPAAESGAPIKPHSGSISWNRWRKRWVTVFMETLGKPSAFGEIWYAEADEPTGPWGPAVKVLSHENYTFYNPLLHPEFTPEGSPLLYFEGTYTMQFTKSRAADAALRLQPNPLSPRSRRSQASGCQSQVTSCWCAEGKSWDVLAVARGGHIVPSPRGGP